MRGGIKKAVLCMKQSTKVEISERVISEIRLKLLMSQFVSGTADTDPEPVKPPDPLSHSLQFCAWRFTIMSITIGNAQSWPQSILLNSFIIHIIVSSYTLKGFIAQMLHYAW